MTALIRCSAYAPDAAARCLTAVKAVTAPLRAAGFAERATVSNMAETGLYE